MGNRKWDGGFFGGGGTPRHIVSGKRCVRLLSVERRDRFVRHPHSPVPAVSTVNKHSREWVRDKISLIELLFRGRGGFVLVFLTIHARL
jgi:hypothetical protein